LYSFPYIRVLYTSYGFHELEVNLYSFPYIRVLYTSYGSHSPHGKLGVFVKFLRRFQVYESLWYWYVGSLGFLCNRAFVKDLVRQSPLVDNLLNLSVGVGH
jgi:hypothetical protein